MRLLNIRIFSPTLRRMAWMKWLPPIDMASPSPVTTQTSSAGLLAFTPVASAGARPWMVWNPYVSM